MFTIRSFDKFEEECKEHRLKPAPGKTIEQRLNYCGLAVSGEGGEVAGEVKKIARDDDGYLNIERKRKILEECGDTLFYLQMTTEEVDSSLEEIAQIVIAKLIRKERERERTP